MARQDVENLNDLVIPVLLERSEGYKPMVAKKRFDAIAGVLAVQAYWLTWFEAMEKMKRKLDGVVFEGGYHGEPQPRWRAILDAKPRDKAGFEAVRRRALSKLHARSAPQEYELIERSLGLVAGSTCLVDPTMADAVIGAAIGPQLSALRMSRKERGALEELLWERAESPAAPKSSRSRL